MHLAARLKKVLPSITLGLNARMLELKSAGKDIVSLGVGEPDIDTPEPICEAGVEAIRRRQCRYTATAGIPELRKNIVEYLAHIYGLEYGVDCVMASSGAKQVLFNSVMATAGPGDEVVIPTPYWTSYPEIVRLAGATPVIIETSADAGFKLSPEALEKGITPRTTALMLNSPSNPSGATYTMEDLLPLAEVLRNKEIWILSDDIYCTLLFDGVRFASMACIPGFKERTIIINGVSKTFSMTGWRIGFGAGCREVISAMTRVQDHSTSCPNAIAQRAAAEALRHGPRLTQDWVATLQSRRDLMVSLVSAIPRVRLIPPTGAFYLFVDVKEYLGKPWSTTLELAEALLMEAGVATIPGEAFGTPGFLRLSFAVSEETIREGVARLARGLAQ